MGRLRKLEREDGTCATDYKEILTICKKFYENFHTTKITKNEEEIKQFLGNISVPQLEANEIYLLEQPITSEECLKTIKSFTTGKSPGNDGISIDFYKNFWPYFGKYVLDSFNEAIIKGELSSSLRQAVVTILDKKKDRTQVKNWRPISLLNNDYKILSKTLATRIIKILPKLIHINQTGRYIGENVRLIKGLLQYTKSKTISGVLIAIDFEKGFDSLEWVFMFSVLEKFVFSKNNISSTVLNNGTTCGYFPVYRGVRQGDPLSPYLFILSIEILGLIIRQQTNIGAVLN